MRCGASKQKVPPWGPDGPFAIEYRQRVFLTTNGRRTRLACGARRSGLGGCCELVELLI